MSRDRRRARSRPTGMPGGTMMRLGSALIALMIIGMMYTRARDPRTWRWLADRDGQAGVAAAATPAAPPVAQPPEEIVPNPTDVNEYSSPDVQTEFAAIGEKSPLAVEEMPLYWRLMKWARAQSFEELQSRTARDVLYTRFFQEPEEYRGKPVQLRLHIKQIVDWAAPENPAGVKTIYEVSGTTDNSRTFYFIVVCPELPPGMKTGTDLNEEGLFVGYFHKVMPYDGAVKKLAAPLLIGRLRNVPRVAAPPVPEIPTWVWMAVLGVIIVAAVWGWRQFANPPPRRKVHTAGVGDEAADWFAAGDGSPAANNESNPPAAG
ncbi:MAG: hypothetical protein JNG89_06580 [Planctomycetaceae bacterium]|nr:hypothetical protein [Planctomycetaceae bacterium]